jgi:hypothetical protein
VSRLTVAKGRLWETVTILTGESPFFENLSDFGRKIGSINDMWILFSRFLENKSALLTILGEQIGSFYASSWVNTLSSFIVATLLVDTPPFNRSPTHMRRLDY